MQLTLPFTSRRRVALQGDALGEVRGTQRDVFVLSVLAPDHSGFTTSEQPSLYWYISAPTSLPVELTVMDPQGVQPILKPAFLQRQSWRATGPAG